MRRILVITPLFALLAFVACSRGSSEQRSASQSPPPEPAAVASPAAQTGGEATGASAATPASPSAAAPVARKSAAASSKRASASANTPSPAGETRKEPAFREFTIPADTVLHVRLETAVASDTSHAEDPVSAALSKPVLVDGVEVVPEGSRVKGVVTEARKSGKVKGRAQVAFRFDELSLPDGQYQVQTRAVAMQAPSTKKSDAVKIGAPAAGGALLGAILGGKKGAAIGAGVGGGAGTAVVLATPGKEVRLSPGTALSVKLLEPVTVRVRADR